MNNIPLSITRSAYVSFIEALGFDPTRITQMTLYPWAISATYLDEDKRTMTDVVIEIKEVV